MVRLSAFLELLRLPAVFTALADVLMGYLCVQELLRWRSDLLLLMVSSSCLYLCGMVFNDVFDRSIDAIERPRRPIPSGRVSLRAAIGLGGGLLASGLIAAFFAGAQSLVVALGLASLVLGYDAVLKKTVLGPIAMGACRFMNVILGASAMSQAADVWRLPQIHLATALGVYIAGLTWLARREAVRSETMHIAGAAMTVNLGFALMAAFVVRWPGTGIMHVALLLAAIGATVNVRFVSVLLDPSPKKVQRAVQAMLVSIIMLDATMVLFLTGRPNYALCVASLIVPCTLLRSRIPVT